VEGENSKIRERFEPGTWKGSMGRERESKCFWGLGRGNRKSFGEFFFLISFLSQ